MLLPLREFSRTSNILYKTIRTRPTYNIWVLQRNSSTTTQPRRSSYTIAIVAASASATLYYLYLKNAHPKTLKTYTREQVANYRNGIWMTYKDGVYDLTMYARERHPGGENVIAAAAGGDLETYWEEYKFHKTLDIERILKEMRIGNLKETDERGKSAKRCKKPKAPPQIDPKDYRLELILNSKTMKSLTLEDVKRYPIHSIVSAIPCKSNEKESRVIKRTWTGARLYDIIHDLDVKTDDYRYVQFECLDANKSGIISIPNESANVLLAYEMDGTELPMEHGYPIRVVIPQLPGRRNVKWLNKIILVKEEKS